MEKIEYEKVTVEKMIRLYCKRKHKTADLCEECTQIRDYALDKLGKCPFGEDKGACRKCEVHCYKSEKREKIKEIMRYSGPRMLLYHPKDFFGHYFIKKTDKDI